jgi:hypothetical protein
MKLWSRTPFGIQMYSRTWLIRHRFIRHPVYSVRYSVASIHSSLPTMTLYSSVRNSFIMTQNISSFHHVITEFNYISTLFLHLWVVLSKSWPCNKLILRQESPTKSPNSQFLKLILNWYRPDGLISKGEIRRFKRIWTALYVPNRSWSPARMASFLEPLFSLAILLMLITGSNKFVFFYGCDSIKYLIGILSCSTPSKISNV